jgi:hypothetical protein
MQQGYPKRQQGSGASVEAQQTENDLPIPSSRHQETARVVL